MGTRSDIIVELNNGKWHRIYCHSDGYLSHNGRILFEYYTDQKHVEALVELGDLSSLGPEIGEKHPFDGPAFFLPGGDSLLPNPAYEEFKKKHGNWCRAYGRDRGEKDVAGSIGDHHPGRVAGGRLLDRVHLRLDRGAVVCRRPGHRQPGARPISAMRSPARSR